MENIDIFNNRDIILKRKRPLSIISYLTIVTVSIIAILLIGIFYEYNPYKQYLGRVVVDGDKYYINVLIEENNIPFINDLIINNNNKYNIIKISNPLYIDLKKYYEVLIQSKIDDNLIIQNNIINIKIKLPTTTLIKELIKRIKKGIN